MPHASRNISTCAPTGLARLPSTGGTRAAHSPAHQPSNSARLMPVSAHNAAIVSPAPSRRNMSREDRFIIYLVSILYAAWRPGDPTPTKADQHGQRPAL